MRLFVLVVVAASACLQAEEAWPSFRGGAAGGLSTNAQLPLQWDTKTNVAWSVGVPGKGWSSPIVLGKRVFVTTAVSSGETLVARKGLYITDLQGKVPPGEYQWLTLCYDLDTGQELWRHAAFQGKPTSTIHIKNSLASETPCTDGQRLYAYFGNVGLAAYTPEGKLLWKQQRPVRKTQMGWGTGASPVAHEGKLFLLNDNEELSELECLDGKTGESLWKVRRDETSNWASPFVWSHALRTEVVTAGKNRVRSYSLEGKLLWELRGMSIVTIPTPFATKDYLIVASGYVLDPLLKPVYAIRPGASGDISLKGDETSNKYIAWCLKQAGPYHPTPIVVGDYLYVLYDRGFLSCWQVQTGKPVYERKRLGGSGFTASPVAYRDHLVCTNEDGLSFVIPVGRDFSIAHKNDLGGMTLASPALVGSTLLIRTQEKLYALRQGSK
ncbi:MAG: PQQ-binding-like beta-propeller repeat protein [Gemmataceae bacterium]